MARRIILCQILLLLIAGCGGPSEDADSSPPVAAAPTTAVEEGKRDGNDLDPDVDELLNPTAASAKDDARTEGPTDDPDGPIRKWRDTAGKVVATAEFVSLMDGKVCLQTEFGIGAVIPLDELSEADRQYVAEQSGGDLVETAQAESPREQADEPPPTEDDPADHPSGPVVDPRAGTRSTPEDYSSTGRRKVVIPFDFESKFDDGRYGSMVGDMFWKKLQREGGFIIPEAMVDVRDLCTANGVKLGPETPLADVKKAVRDYFDADIGIWGSVERVPGNEWDVYDLVIKCVDFTSGSEPKTVYEVSARTNVVSEIPHLYGQQLLDKLYDRQPGEPSRPDPIAEENWQKNPNLVVGDFQTGTDGVPKGWAPVGGQHREPLGRQVSWVAETGNTYNKVIRLTFDEGVGNSYGVMYYSDWFPVDEGARYRFQCRYRTNGPAVKVFIKCYAEMPSEYRGGGAGGGSDYHPGANGYVPEEMQRRECYRSQQNLKGPKNVWNVQTEDFTPKHTKYTPKWGRVMLYGYLGAGVVEFDDVVVKQIMPASPSESKKDPRHSMESTVTIEEMRENERRGREAVEQMRKEAEEER